jgi:DNA polymerase-3 subunit epsilon
VSLLGRETLHTGLLLSAQRNAHGCRTQKECAIRVRTAFYLALAMIILESVCEASRSAEGIVPVPPSVRFNMTHRYSAMFKNLRLERSLAIIDLETTGVDPARDRIVEISVLKILPDGRRKQLTLRLNPGIPIPAEATAVHGIADADVEGEPGFAAIAAKVLDFIAECDFGGFNLKRFDLRVLNEEFKRAGHVFSLEGRAIVDAMEIFHAMEPRNLAAAVRFYCKREHEGSHAAGADVLATADVLDAMLARYEELPRTVAGLHEQFADASAVDSGGRFKRVGEEVRFAFGKHRGVTLDAVARADPAYLQWMLAQDFLDDAKAIVREALSAR